LLAFSVVRFLVEVSSFTLKDNVWALGAEADFEAQN